MRTVSDSRAAGQPPGGCHGSMASPEKSAEFRKPQLAGCLVTLAVSPGIEYCRGGKRQV